MVEAAQVVEHQTQVDLVDQAVVVEAVVNQEPQVKVILHLYHLLKDQMVRVWEVILGVHLSLVVEAVEQPQLVVMARKVHTVVLVVMVPQHNLQTVVKLNLAEVAAEALTYKVMVQEDLAAVVMADLETNKEMQLMVVVIKAAAVEAAAAKVETKMIQTLEDQVDQVMLQ